MTELKDKVLQAIHVELQSDKEDENSFDIFEEQIEKISEEYGGTETIAAVLEILREESHSNSWYLSASVLSWLVDDTIDLPCDWSYLVAILYLCLETLPDLGVTGTASGENLVWSIAQEVRNVDYMSEWNPLEDSEVLTNMEEIKQQVES